MPLDPILIADTKAWLAKASNDLRGAEIDLSARPPLIEDALFHSQQAIEKSLKAFLTFHNARFRKTHSIEEIGELCLCLDPSLKDIVDTAVPLTEYAWAFRYPGPVQEIDLAEGKEALVIARRVFKEIGKRLPRETKP